MKVDNSRSVIEVFKNQVKNSNSNIALEVGTHRYSYDEVDQKSDIVALELLNNGVSVGDFIPVIMCRSQRLIFVILGILKVGAIYVPISEEYPRERINYIIEDTNAKLVITEKMLDVKKDISFLNINNMFFKNNLKESLDIAVTSENDSLYCIYTSGTTGTPKGVINTNAGCLNRIKWMQKEYPISNGDKILQKTNYIFDVSIWEFFWWFFNGATCVLLEDGEQGNPEKIYQTIIKENITVIHFVPTMLSAYLKYLQENKIKDDSKLKWVFSSGEALPPSYGTKFYKYSKGSLVNLYGPTEASIDVTYYLVSGEEQKMPIGRPISNMNIIIANPKTLEICEEGIEGEIFISGIGLAKEYLNNPDKTEEVFLRNPFGKGRAYRTGDYGYIENGLVFYSGRKDKQIKINGYRVELNEILSCLKELEDIEDARVIFNKGLVYSLQLYYISKNKIRDEIVRKYLEEHLPYYMVPHEYYQIDKFPTTLNGKLDEKALLQFSKNKDLSTNLKEDLSRDERIIYDSLKKSLGKQNIDLRKNYIALGGDSMKAIRALSELRKSGFNCSIKQILTSKNIYELCQMVNKEFNEFEDNVSKFGMVKDTPIMKLFKKYNMKKPGHFNQIRSKNEKNLNGKEIRNFLIKLAKLHPELGAKFTNEYELNVVNQEFTNMIFKNRRKFYDLDWESELENLLIEGELEFKEQEQLFKVIIFEMREKCVLLFIAHHLIIDEISWKVIFDDYNLISQNRLMNDIEIVSENKLGTSFRSWSYFLSNHKNKYLESIEADYWRSKNEEFLKLNKYLNKLSNNKNNNIVNISRKISSVSTFQRILKDKYYSMFDVVLYLIKESLMLCHKELDTLPLLIESHGRSEFSGEIRTENTVGWFTSYYPMLIGREENLEKSLFNIHKLIKLVPNEGVGYGLLFDEFDYVTPHFLFNFFGDLTEENDIQNVRNFFKYEKAEVNFCDMHPMKIDVMILKEDVMITIEAQQKFYSSLQLERIVENVILKLSEFEDSENNKLNIDINVDIDYDDFFNILNKLN